jgi:hypothetical protein
VNGVLVRVGTDRLERAGRLLARRAPGDDDVRSTASFGAGQDIHRIFGTPGSRMLRVVSVWSTERRPSSTCPFWLAPEPEPDPDADAPTPYADPLDAEPPTAGRRLDSGPPTPRLRTDSDTPDSESRRRPPDPSPTTPEPIRTDTPPPPPTRARPQPNRRPATLAATVKSETGDRCSRGRRLSDDTGVTV